MRRFLLAIFSGMLLLVLALAQETPATQNGTSAQAQQSAEPSQSAPAAQQPAQTAPLAASNSAAAHPTETAGSPRIAAGSVIPVQLSKSIDARKAKTGDEVIAKVTEDMKSDSGAVLVPKDTKVFGHVTEAQARNKEQKESELGIAFDHAVTKTGEMQMPMSIQAVIAPPSAGSNNGSSGADQASAPTPSGPGAMPSVPGHSSAGTATPAAPPTGNMPGDTGASNTSARPQITAKTEGIIGISDLKLSSTPGSAQGSVLSSEKNNVKLESGTMMLLRVN